MALRRFTRPIDGTIPVPALLYDDEDWIASQDNVGIYDGSQKSPNHQMGSIHVSTHRLFYVGAQDADTRSFALDLSSVTQTDYYAGLFKSSPKVTLYLSSINSSTALGSGTDPITSVPAPFESWECEVCAFRNPPGLSPAAARICTLCGVPRSVVPVPDILPPSLPHQSTSLPSSSPISGTTTPISQEHSVATKACPACTFLNHPSLLHCEICATLLPTAARLSERSNIGASAKSAPTSRPASPDDDDDVAPRMIKVSFRKGGDKVFYSALKRCLKGKAWEIINLGNSSQRHGSGASTDRPTTTRSGINGILQVVEASAQNRQDNLSDSLQDLEALMNKAREMVRLAADLNEKLTASTAQSPPTFPTTDINTIGLSDASATPAEPEEATFIRSSLSQLGLQMTNTPVTLDMMKDERKWFDELARELAGILQGSSPDTSQVGSTELLGERGILALDEVWGGWNRARGVALIPPSTFLQVIPLLPSYTNPPIRRRTFTSGLSVLHTPPYTDAAFAARLSSLLALSGPKTTIELAQEEKVSVGLAAEMIDAVEQGGHICRDDGRAKIKGGGSGGGAEVRWWANVLQTYVWDGGE